MRTVMLVITIMLVIGFAASLGFGNPALLPKHPGYPMGKAVDPVTGQSLANDPGQPNAVGEKAILEAATAEDAHVRQNLNDPNNQRIVQSAGAGQLPKVQGPNIMIEPPVKEATRMK